MASKAEKKEIADLIEEYFVKDPATCNGLIIAEGVLGLPERPLLEVEAVTGDTTGSFASVLPAILNGEKAYQANWPEGDYLTTKGGGAFMLVTGKRGGEVITKLPAPMLMADNWVLVGEDD